MSSQLTRRDWLRASGFLTAGFGLSRFTSAEAAAPAAPLVSGFTNEFAFADDPFDKMPKLRARLFANENPLGISANAKEALIKATEVSNRYAWMEFKQLKTLIAADDMVKPENIMLSPGSSDVLMAAADHFAKDGGTILTSALTYDDLLERATKFGAKVKALPMTKDYKFDLNAIKASLTESSGPAVKLVYIVNPNNPTGTTLPMAELEAFCREVAPKVPVFIDEAYIDFYEPADRPKLGKLVAEGLNIILARTFSKIHGFAGLRLGYAIAQPELLKTMHAYTNAEFAVSITTLMAGIASYKDTDWQNHCRAENTKARDYTTKALTTLGYEVIPSATNFILFPIRMKTKTFENQMFAQGIGIQTRDFNGQPYCRVSIGTMDEMAIFVDGFKKVVG